MSSPLQGFDKDKVAKVQEVGAKISGVIKIDHVADTLTLKMTSEDPQARIMIKNILPQFAEQIANLLSVFFSIKGKIVDVNKPKAT